jgi:DNA-binding NarL/FixJ family response regulator
MAQSSSRKLGCGIRILIVDDHAAIREGLCSLLGREPGFEVCGDVGTVAAALAFIRLEPPTVAVIDISIGNESGLDLIRRIRELNDSIRILAWSMYDDLLYAERALAAGAMGYINKRESVHTIVLAIRAIKAGDVYLSAAMKNHMLHRSIGTGGRSKATKSPIESLSNRELEVFRMIGNGLTTAEISKSLHLSVKTIETHRHRIKLKLQLDDANKLVREATQWVLENG